MKLKDLTQDVEIICKNANERQSAIRVLTELNVPYAFDPTELEPFDEYPHIWVQASSREWWECASQGYLKCQIEVPAADFIASNTIPDHSTPVRMLAAILILIALFVAWVIAINRKAAKTDKIRSADMEKIRHMDSSELSDYLNLKK